LVDLDVLLAFDVSSFKFVHGFWFRGLQNSGLLQSRHGHQFQ